MTGCTKVKNMNEDPNKDFRIVWHETKKAINIL